MINIRKISRDKLGQSWGQVMAFRIFGELPPCLPNHKHTPTTTGKRMLRSKPSSPGLLGKSQILRWPTHSKFASIWWGLPAVRTSISGRAYDQLSSLRTLTQPCGKLGPSVRLTDLMDRPVDAAYESVGFKTILRRSSMSTMLGQINALSRTGQNGQQLLDSSGQLAVTAIRGKSQGYGTHVII